MYLNRGMRTVQRWEREAGLPVHRLQNDKLGYAWWSSLRSTLEDAGQPNGPSIAVLPFADISREKDQQYFCDGIAEEITGALSKIKKLRRYPLADKCLRGAEHARRRRRWS